MQNFTTLNLSRRTFLKAGALLASCAAFPSIASASLPPVHRAPVRSVYIVNPHTGDKLKTVYWEKGLYNPEPLKDIAYILRDQHSGEMSPIDPRLIDILHDLLLYAHKNLLR